MILILYDIALLALSFLTISSIIYIIFITPTAIHTHQQSATAVSRKIVLGCLEEREMKELTVVDRY